MSAEDCTVSICLNFLFPAQGIISYHITSINSKAYPFHFPAVKKHVPVPSATSEKLWSTRIPSSSQTPELSRKPEMGDEGIPVLDHSPTPPPFLLPYSPSVQYPTDHHNFHIFTFCFCDGSAYWPLGSPPCMGLQLWLHTAQGVARGKLRRLGLDGLVVMSTEPWDRMLG